MSDSQDGQRDLPAGTILDDRFEIKKRLGAGSFGEVYEANQIVFGQPLRPVALKLFFSDSVTADNVNEVFNDAITLLGLQEEQSDPEVSRRLVQVYDMGLLDNDRRAFMSMRLVPGSRTLLDAVRRHGKYGMPVNLALTFMQQMLAPLAWMHTLCPAAVHGDLKPDNVLLTTDTDLVLTDFGLAGRVPLGTRGGAIAYQAPETLNRLGGRTQSDIYAVGIMLYEMLTGTHPFGDVGIKYQDVDQAKYIAEHRAARKWTIRPADHWNPVGDTHRIVPMQEINADLTDHPQLQQIVARCLAWSESERYRDAKQLLEVIEHYAQHRTIPQADPGSPPSPPGQTTGSSDSSPTARSVRLADAQAYRLQGDFGEALTIVEELLTSDRDCTEAWILKAKIHLDQSDIAAARTSSAEARRCSPKSSESWNVAADVLEASGQRDMAVSFRKQAFRLRANTHGNK